MRKASARLAPTALSKSIDRNLRVYSTAALAAGVGILALAKPAQGEVVVTKKTIIIPENPQNSAPAGIDFNHDGINDLSAGIYYSAYPLSVHSLDIFPPNFTDNGAAVVASRNGYALALARGAKIGPSAHFGSRTRRIEYVNGNDSSTGATYTRTLKGNWGGNPVNRYLGVKFLIKGKTHYGWIRLTVITDPRGLSATITGYAYETVPNKRITAGTGASSASATIAKNQKQKLAATSLGMLALGTDGLAIWRRKEDPAIASASVRSN
ncbi:MAG: hypothetical protein ACRD3B_17105 [Candidatus Sulfotelmatobacter sp.]